jgi:CRISPR-associated protein Csb2
VGFAREGWVEGALPAEALEIATALTEGLPVYALPPASTAHTRHYMPIGAKTTKVFDTFAYIGDGELWARWDADLSPPARAMLANLAGQLPYLGRAESWVECELFDALPASVTVNAMPVGAGNRGEDTALVLAPVSGTDYDSWRGKALELACAGLTKAKRKKVESTYPVDGLAALLSRTGDLQSAGWTRPPGSRDVLYRVPDRALNAPPRAFAHIAPARARAEFALYVVTGDSQRGTVRPRMEQALPVAELLHWALAKRLDGVVCPEIAGRDESGSPLVGHQHAHILPLDVDGDRRLDHILIWTPMGMGPEACEALHAVRRLWDSDHDAAAFVELAGTGGRREIKDTLDALSSDVCAASRTWATATPFVAPRHIKQRGANTLEAQILSELQSRGLPAPSALRIANREALADSGFHEFVRARRGKKRAPPNTRPVHFELEFDEPLVGPVALGYGAHFGLGQLRPVAR